MLISDIDVRIDNDKSFKFILDDKRKPVQMKICDLGLSEMYGNDEQGSITWNTSRNVGKECYKSPEMLKKGIKCNAAANDVWCLGVTLFMMLIGCHPMKTASINDPNFRLIMKGEIGKLLEILGRKHYVSVRALDLLESIFKYEDERISIEDIKQHPWLN